MWGGGENPNEIIGSTTRLSFFFLIKKKDMLKLNQSFITVKLVI